MTIAVDVLNREACIPGDGTAPITMIYSYDAATLVAKMLEVDDWPEFTFCNGEDTTLGKCLKIGEKLCGTSPILFSHFFFYSYPYLTSLQARNSKSLG